MTEVRNILKPYVEMAKMGIVRMVLVTATIGFVLGSDGIRLKRLRPSVFLEKTICW